MNDIERALNDGPTSASFERLLVNFGQWSRFSGCNGYHSSGDDRPTPVITDDDALKLDRCLARLKALHELGYWLFKEYYIKECSCDIISMLLERKGRREKKTALQYATKKRVQELLDEVRLKIFKFLMEMNSR